MVDDNIVIDKNEPTCSRQNVQQNVQQNIHQQNVQQNVHQQNIQQNIHQQNIQQNPHEENLQQNRHQQNARNWRKSIIQQLNERRNREQKPFEEVINFCSHLFDALDSMRSENVGLNAQLSLQKERLLLQNNENNGPNGRVVNDRNSALDQKMFQMQEELTELHRRKGENAQIIIELKNQLEENSKERVFLMNRLHQVEEELAASKSACKACEQQILEMESQHQVVKDEHEALQIAFNCLEKRCLALDREHCDLVARWMSLKAKDADKMNAENEMALKAQHDRLRQQLEEAARNTTVDESLPSNAPIDLPSVESLYVCARIPNKVMLQFEAHEGEVSAIKWSQSGHIVATGGADRKVKLWEIAPTATVAMLKGTLTGSNAAVTSIDLDQDLLLASSNDFASRVWTLNDMKLRRTLTGHSNKVLAVKFLGVSNKVVSGSHDRTLKIWDLNRHACIRTLFAGSSCNDLVTCQGKDSVVASAHFDKRIRFWDTRSDSSANEILLQGKVTSLDVSPSGYYLLCCVRDDTLKSLDLRMNQVERTFCADGFKVGCDYTRCKFSPDNEYIVAGSNDGSIYIWNASSGKVEKVLRDQHNCTVIASAWNPSGNLLMSTDKNKRAIVWSEF